MSPKKTRNTFAFKCQDRKSTRNEKRFLEKLARVGTGIHHLSFEGLTPDLGEQNLKRVMEKKKAKGGGWGPKKKKKGEHKSSGALGDIEIYLSAKKEKGRKKERENVTYPKEPGKTEEAKKWGKEPGGNRICTIAKGGSAPSKSLPIEQGEPEASNLEPNPTQYEKRK